MVGVSNNEIDPEEIQKLMDLTNGDYTKDQIHAVLKKCNLDPDYAIRRVIERNVTLHGSRWGRGRSGGRGCSGGRGRSGGRGN